MQNMQKGAIPMVLIAVVAIVLATGSFWFYQQTSKQKTPNEQLPAVENNGGAGGSGDIENTVSDIPPSEIKTESEAMESGNPSGDQGKPCPVAAVPGPEFCPGGEILAKSTNGCVVGYDCQKMSETSLKCDSGCKQQGYESGKCIQKKADMIGTGEGSYTEPLNGVASDCVASYGECLCKIAANNSCAVDSDCIDPGCGECVNEDWSASNDPCTSVADARKICKCVAKKCAAMSTCGDGKCDAAYETKINCQQDCGQAIANKSCNTKADCIDDGTTCHVCVNAAWLKQNPDWSTKYACDGIGAAVCDCQGGCVAVGE